MRKELFVIGWQIVWICFWSVLRRKLLGFIHRYSFFQANASIFATRKRFSDYRTQKVAPEPELVISIHHATTSKLNKTVPKKNNKGRTLEANEVIKQEVRRAVRKMERNTRKEVRKKGEKMLFNQDWTSKVSKYWIKCTVHLIRQQSIVVFKGVSSRSRGIFQPRVLTILQTHHSGKRKKPPNCSD